MSGAFAIAFLTILAYDVSAQAVPLCLPGYTLLYNSLNQTPCDMTIALGGVCSNSKFILPPLSDPNDIYTGPLQGPSANSCQCSSVYYSVLSACAACQNHNFLSWSKYKSNCTTVYDRVFQGTIPSSTRIPHYAYLDVATGDNFNVSAAENAGGIESTAIPQSTATATSAPTSTVNSSKSKAGPIAGGVVGGVVFLTILGGLVAFILRRRKQSAPYPSTYNTVASPDPMMSYGNSSSIPTSVAQGRIYDPNDPSTFPTNDLVNYQSSLFQQQGPVTPTITGSGTMASMPTGPARPHYTGAPEL